ncbi:MAG: hypothetical protein VKI42_03080 [Synechococcaceae cyanobacterium]|nr:hypothetical protein [Synechococcaceae cyanobacterium]
MDLKLTREEADQLLTLLEYCKDPTALMIRERLERLKATTRFRQCDHCGSDFEAAQDHQRFCRVACRVAAHRKETRRLLYGQP